MCIYLCVSEGDREWQYGKREKEKTRETDRQTDKQRQREWVLTCVKRNSKTDRDTEAEISDEKEV